MDIPSLNFTPDELKKAVNQARIAAEAFASEEDLKLALSCIDLTTLNPTDTVSFVTSFVHKVNRFSVVYPDLPGVAAVCVYPNMVSTVKETLGSGEIKIASVAGGFPSSMTFPEIKIEEAKRAVMEGADEIDIVLPLWAFLDGNQELCIREISNIKNSIGDAHLKVILESGLLAEPEKIWQASVLALSAGADFIKTSTGKLSPAATPEAAYVMSRAIGWWHETTGEKRGFKPAGGISEAKDAMVYLNIVRNTLGTDWLDNSLFRIGASRLANNLLSVLFNKQISHF